MAFLISISGAPVNSDDFNGVVGSVFGPVAATGSNNVDDGSFAQTDDAFLEGSYLDVVTDVIFRTGGNDTICPIVTQTPNRIDYTVPNVADGTYTVIMLVDANNVVTEFPTPFSMQVSLTSIFIPGDGTTPWLEVLDINTIVGNGTLIRTISSVSTNTGARVGHVLIPALSYTFSVRALTSGLIVGTNRTQNFMGLRREPVDIGSYHWNLYSHSIYQNDSNFDVREDGVSRGTFGTIVPNDILTIRHTYQLSPAIDLVEYLLNGVVLYTSLVPISTGNRWPAISAINRADLDQIKVTEL